MNVPTLRSPQPRTNFVRLLHFDGYGLDHNSGTVAQHASGRDRRYGLLVVSLISGDSITAGLLGHETRGAMTAPGTGTEPGPAAILFF